MTRPETHGRHRSHGHVAWCYDEIADFYSAGAICEAKTSHLDSLEAGEHVLYAGVGRGEEAVLAAASGVKVTALDLSQRMLGRLDRSLQDRGLHADLVQGCVFEHVPERPYAAVVANFFLNVFGEREMRCALARLTSWLEPGGRFLIADFAPPRGRGFDRVAAVSYYRPVNVAAWMLGLCALHPIYDYADHFEGVGLELATRVGFRPWRRAPRLYECISAIRRESSVALSDGPT